MKRACKKIVEVEPLTKPVYNFAPLRAELPWALLRGSGIDIILQEYRELYGTYVCDRKKRKRCVTLPDRNVPGWRHFYGVGRAY